MTLKQKLLLTSLVSALLFVGVVIIVNLTIIRHQFQHIEEQRVERNIRRVEAVIEDRYTQMINNLGDWTIWDDAYEFMEDENKEFVESNISQESFASSNTDEALFINAEGKLILSFRLDSLPKEEDFPDDLYQHFQPGSKLLEFDKELGYGKGIVRSDDGLLLYGVREVLDSNGKGDPHGVIVFARYFDDQMIDSMKDLTQFEASLVLFDDPQMKDDYQVVRDNYLAKSEKQYVRAVDNNLIAGYFVVEDVYGKPQAIVRSEIEREISAQGESSMMLQIVTLTVTGILVLLLNYMILNLLILRRVLTLGEDVVGVGLGTKSQVQVDKKNDELSKLSTGINEMLLQLQSSNELAKTGRENVRSYIDVVGVMVVAIGIDEKVMLINKKAGEILGVQPNEVIGKNWFESFVPEEIRTDIRNLFTKVVSGAKDTEYQENWVQTKNGDRRMIAWHNATIKDEQGKVIASLSAGEDVTDRKQSEQENARHALEVEQLNELMVGRELKMMELKRELTKKKETSRGK